MTHALWHRLLAPLPADARPVRRAVAPPEVLAASDGAAIAGWTQLVVELSAGAAGLRVVLVVIDETGRWLSAADRVLFGAEGDASCESMRFTQESIGGRFAPNGDFVGTRWTADSANPPVSISSPPVAADVAALKLLVADILRRDRDADPPT